MPTGRDTPGRAAAGGASATRRAWVECSEKGSGKRDEYDRRRRGGQGTDVRSTVDSRVPEWSLHRGTSGRIVRGQTVRPGPTEASHAAPVPAARPRPRPLAVRRGRRGEVVFTGRGPLQTRR